MEVLASFVGGWGHAEPLLEAAGLARERGHRVTFAGQSAVLPRLEALGFATVVVGPDTIATERLPLQRPDRDHERRVIAEHFVAGFGRSRAAALGEVIERMRPALVICDEVDVGASIAGERAGIDVVTVNVIMAGRLFSAAVVGDAWNGLRRGQGLAIDPDCSRLGGLLALAPFPASFRDPAIAPSKQWRPVRPTAIAEASPPHQRTRDLVYATLGTIFNVESGDLLARVIAGVDLPDRDSLVTVGPGISPGEFTTTGRVRVEQYVPQAEVLPRCAAVVCHGGSGTLTAALSIGVPVVVLPMGADQMDNGDRCAQLGCGVVLDAVDASAADISATVEQVIRDPRFAEAAQRLAGEAAGQPHLADVEEFTHLLSR